MSDSPLPPIITRAHRAACDNRERTYQDPISGYRVFSAWGHLERGYCCGCGCRHCPFEPSQGAEDAIPWIRTPVLLLPTHLDKTAQESVVLFWSGGKDSYLTYLKLREQNPNRQIILLNTFDGNTQVVAHQNIPFRFIKRQAEALGLPLMAVPLFPKSNYIESIQSGLKLLGKSLRPQSVAFGDLHLETIRDWRLEAFAQLQESFEITLEFPLWQASYDGLTQTLSRAEVDVRFSAVTDASLQAVLRPGTSFQPEQLVSLGANVDPFGENGEFHTVVCLGFTHAEMEYC